MILSGADSEIDMTPDLIEGLKLRHPQIDVQAELYKIHLWLTRYPARRPKMLFRFIDNWCKKVKIKPVKIHLVNGKMTESEILALGKQKGMEPRPGESYEKFLQRLRA